MIKQEILEFNCQAGNTVRLFTSFYDFQKNKIIPQNVCIIIYNNKWEQLELITEGITQLDGLFYLDYITNREPKMLYVEWKGFINNKPSLRRSILRTTDI